MHDASLIGLTGRLVVAMGVVLGVMMLAARVVRAKGIGGLTPNGARRASTKPVRIEVLAREGIGKGTSVTVVRAAGKALVLGITESSVTVLAEADPAALEPLTSDKEERVPEANWTASKAGVTRLGPSWKAMLELARERTVRRA